MTASIKDNNTYGDRPAKATTRGKRRGQNEGSIYQRKDGRWAASLDLGWQDGKRKRKHFLARTRREVQVKLNQALHDKQTGIPIVTERQTYGQFLLYWLQEAVKPTVRPKTYSSYEQLVRLHILPTLGRIQLTQLSPQQVQSLLNQKRASALSPRTVQYVYTIIRSSLSRAVRWGLAPRNVATLVDRPRTVKKEIRPLNPEQARTFLTAVKRNVERLEALYVVALLEGLREGELLGLRWEDVDLQASTLTVRKALQRINGKQTLVEPKSRSSRRTISLSNMSVMALRAHRVRQLEDRMLAGVAWKGNSMGLIFTSSVGTPLEPSGVVKRYKRILDEAGLPKQRFHDLRHACASLMLANGSHPRVIMAKLGHSEISLTMNTYAHPIPELQREAASRMDALLIG